jgi:hypothetical protein
VAECCGRCERHGHVLKYTALLAAFILILAGCTSESTPDSTSGPLVVIGTAPTSPTPSPNTPDTSTTTRAWIDPAKCSSADLDGVVEDYPEAYEGLTDAVATTRRAIIEAALSCDFAALTALAAVGFPELGPGADRTEQIFEGATTNFDEFVAYDQQHSALRKLVLALSSVPVIRIDSETKDRVPVVFFEWPPDPYLWDEDTSTYVMLDEVWDADIIKRVSAMNGITPDELIANMADSPAGYGLFRIVILDDGRWLGT